MKNSCNDTIHPTLTPQSEFYIKYEGILCDGITFPTPHITFSGNVGNATLYKIFY